MAVKAFNIQLVLGRENIMGNKPKVTIECFNVSGKNIYIGTNDCTLFHFLLLEDVKNEAKKSSRTMDKSHSLSAFMQNQKKLGLKKSIIQISACNEIKQLLVNCDNSIYVYSMMDLSITATLSNKIKHVNKFYINSNPVHANPFSVEVCVSFVKKKSVQLFQISEDNVLLLRDISLSDPLSAVALDGRHLCMATNLNYVIMDIETGNKLELFPVTDQKPMVQRVAPAEFLLTAPNSLGVFVTSGGISQRPPIQWSESVFQTEYLHPYIVALDEDFITVHSIMDQQQKQTLPFQGGLQLIKCDNMLLICTKKDMFIMTMIPYDVQIGFLLSSKLVEEALNLSKACRKCMSQKEYLNMMQIVYRKCGFVYFEDMNFELAETMFIKGALDARELISLYPGILPANSKFSKSIIPLHDIANVFEICNHDKEKIHMCFDFLCDYLQRNLVPVLFSKIQKGEQNGFSVYAKHLSYEKSYHDDIFMSCICIFSKQKRSSNLLSTLNIDCEETESIINSFQDSEAFQEFSLEWEDSLKILHDNQCYHIQAIAHLLEGKLQAAFNLWKELCMGNLTDTEFPGLSFVAKCLSRYCTDSKMLWFHAEWILTLDEKIGTEIFTMYLPHYNAIQHKCNQQNVVCCPKPDDVIDFLHHFPASVITYLEHLVFVQKLEKEKYHTHLVVLYLENVLKLLNENETNQLEMMRVKFQAILKHSNLYRITLILSKINDTILYNERVILHGKLGEHQQALDILVNLMKDQTAAESYCIEQALNDEHKKRLFAKLLSVYLSKISEANSKGSKSTVAVISLLNKYAENYDACQVLEMLPKTWSVTVLQQFLSRTLRLPKHNADTKQIEKMLAKAENLQMQKEEWEMTKKPVLITEEKLCLVCNRSFQSSDCVLYPNGVAVHVQCGRNKLICPVTGKMFKCLPSKIEKTTNNINGSLK